MTDTKLALARHLIATIVERYNKGDREIQFTSGMVAIFVDLLADRDALAAQLAEAKATIDDQERQIAWDNEREQMKDAGHD